MALALSCTCGAHFDLDESLAQQTVSCPECQQPVQVPAVERRQVRTSGWALAGTVVGLVLAFTGIGTVLAILFGILGLTSIARNRGQIAGTGYAIFSIAWGTVFTGLFLFAVIKGEVFGLGEGLRESLMAGAEVERDGPMEIRRPKENFVITRPGPKWYVAKPSLAEELVDDADGLVLVNLARDARISVSTQSLTEQSLEGYRDALLKRFREPGGWDFERKKPRPRLSNCTVRDNRKLPRAGGLERIEILLDVKVDGVWQTYLIRLLHNPKDNLLYEIRGWAARARFSRVEPELREGMDSFRLLEQDP